MIVAGFFFARYWRSRRLPAYFLIQVVMFAVLTGLLLEGGAVPYRPRLASGSELARLFVGALEVTWWVGASRVCVGFRHHGKYDLELSFDLAPLAGNGLLTCRAVPILLWSRACQGATRGAS